MTELATRVRSGDLRALARAATLVENRAPHAQELMRELFGYTGRALVIGVTGPPGAGKSTFTDQLSAAFRREGRTAGIIAVDPTSPYTGGAILGDRIRMQRHFDDEGVFIRSMATRGWMGGLARATTDMVLLFDAAGRDVIVVETVGVGQDEVDIARLADVTMVLLAPGMGDDVQAIKAGILEVADVFILNKADQPGIEKLERELKSSVQMSHRPDGWVPPVVRTIAAEGQGIGEALDAARQYHARGVGRSRSREIWAMRLREMVRERLLEKLAGVDFESRAQRILERREDPYTAVDELVNQVRERADKIG